MRLGLIGPCIPRGNVSELETGAFHLIEEHSAERVVYLGDDGTLEKMVEQFARHLVGSDPTDDAVWHRAAPLIVDGSAQELDAFIAVEKKRLQLRSLESLPPRVLRTMEMVGDRVAVLIYDKSILDEEDIFSANLIVFGKSELPLVKKIGSRWFVSPGFLGPTGGLIVLDDSGDEIQLTLLEATGQALKTEVLDFGRTAKMQIQA